MANVGLPLREWSSNSLKVLSTLSEDLVPNDSKVLGYVYSRKEDVIRLKNAYLDFKCNTKRKVLSAIASIFDPLGVLAPLLIPAKIFMRELVHSKYHWNDNLSTAHLRKWVKISNDFASSLDASEFSIPRMVAEAESPANLVVFFGCFQKQLRLCSVYSPGRDLICFLLKLNCLPSLLKLSRLLNY